MLEPRRLAARTAAARMASTLREQVGDTVGLRVRFDLKVTKRTRIEIVTEGVFTRLVLEDPLSMASPRCCSTNSTNGRWMPISGWRWPAMHSWVCDRISSYW